MSLKNKLQQVKARRQFKKYEKKKEKKERKEIIENLKSSLLKAGEKGYNLNVLKRSKHLNKPFYHGTNSAALVFLNKTKGRLVPFGKLEKKKVIPFSGELEMGLLNASEEGGVRKGPNYEYISGVEAKDLDVALRYASPRQWSVEKEKQKIKERSELKKQHPDLGNYFMSLFDKKNEISKKRIEEYKKLNKADKKLVEEGFPVVVASEGEVERIPIHSDTHDIFLKEVNLRRRGTTLFVPESKVNETRLALIRKGVVGAKVMPLSKLEEFKRISEVRGERKYGPNELQAHPQNWPDYYPKTKEKKTRRTVKKEQKWLNRTIKRLIKGKL